MGRSPSPKRKKERHRDRSKRRKRSRSRSRKRSDERKRRHQSDSDLDEYERSRRTRSKSYERDRKRSPLPSSSTSKIERGKVVADASSSNVDEQEMMKIMGFSGFSSTKGKKVEGNDVGEVHVILKRKYRQYMNRKGGFNRPLDFVA